MSCNYFFWKSKHYIESFGHTGLFSYLPDFCCFYIFPLSKFCMVIAIFGLLVTAMDIYRIVVDGPILSNSIWPMTSEDKNKSVSEEKERDIKLVTAVIEWTIYCCLFMGIYNSHAVLLLPWLWLKSFLLLSSLFGFLMRLIGQKAFMISLNESIKKCVEIHNILYVSCLFNALYC